MLLTLNERFALLDILPTTGDYTTGKIVRTLRELLIVPREEVLSLGGKIDPEDGRIKWEDDATTAAEIELTPQHIAEIVNTLQTMERAKKLDFNRDLTLCDKFLAEAGG